jgi:hypothetical protein
MSLLAAAVEVGEVDTHDAFGDAGEFVRRGVLPGAVASCDPGDAVRYLMARLDAIGFGGAADQGGGSGGYGA